jgi:hypothetical protein
MHRSYRIPNRGVVNPDIQKSENVSRYGCRNQSVSIQAQQQGHLEILFDSVISHVFRPLLAHYAKYQDMSRSQYIFVTQQPSHILIEDCGNYFNFNASNNSFTSFVNCFAPSASTAATSTVTGI